MPWPALNRLVNLRTQELVLVIGAPGGGKSTFALNLVLGMPAEWTLYVAQDTPHSAVTGLAALAAGVRKQDVVADAVNPALLREKAPRLVVAEGSQTVDSLTLKLDALKEWIGQYPALVVIDNLIDLTVTGESYQSPTFYSTALPQLKQLAIHRDLAIMLLHHVTKGGKEDGKTPLTLDDSLHAGGRDARHVWGLYHSTRHMSVQILKQNNGAADAAGSIQCGLSWNPEYGLLEDFQKLAGEW